MYQKLVAVLAAAFLYAAAGSACAKLYTFSYEFPPGEVKAAYEGFGTIITGSFEGSDDGTFITVASNLKVSVNGSPFPAILSTYMWTGSGFVPGPGTFAFDGVKNNFVITDCADIRAPDGCVNSLFLFIGSGPIGPVYGRVGADAPILRPNRGAWDDIGADGTRAGVWNIQAVKATPSPSTVAVIEYYNASFDHYFITWIAGEIAILDAGTTIKGWVRTGRTFRTYQLAQPGTTPVCRYYIPPAKGDSHFFGRGPVECSNTGVKNPTFVLEDSQFMHMFLPDAGTCPANTTPVQRVFSNRPDANHRYTIDVELRNAMVARQWLAEGDGPDLVVMCAPQ